jgi:uracil-DNA glycosylase
MDDLKRQLYAYLSQQKELGAPDYVLSAKLNLFPVAKPVPVPKAASLSVPPKKAFAPSAAAPARPVASAAQKERKKDPVLFSAVHLHGAPASQRPAGVKPDAARDALVKLHGENKDCVACGLGASRKNFVFGSGSAAAGLMVIGEAPGAEEDEQGLPFVGASGELLTKMLGAIKCDRKKDVFIANVVKCRPPQNRNPDSAEILACKHILMSQIDIIKPRVILLLGRIAAHTLLDTKESIAALRTGPHTLAGIPAFVTYHPAALLRNEENKRPAWEDMQKVQRALAESQTQSLS